MIHHIIARISVYGISIQRRPQELETKMMLLSLLAVGFIAGTCSGQSETAQLVRLTDAVNDTVSETNRAWRLKKVSASGRGVSGRISSGLLLSSWKL